MRLRERRTAQDLEEMREKEVAPFLFRLPHELSVDKAAPEK